jgi:hypothetical protein
MRNLLLTDVTHGIYMCIAGRRRKASKADNPELRLRPSTGLSKSDAFRRQLAVHKKYCVTSLLSVTVFLFLTSCSHRKEHAAPSLY